MAYDRLYAAFLHEFNVERDYYECHEVLEELWLEEGRDRFWQGLLQIAVALYHFRNGNHTGAIKLFRGGLDKLAREQEVARGIDVGLLRQEAQTYLHKLTALEQSPFVFYDLTIRIADPELAASVRAYGENKK